MDSHSSVISSILANSVSSFCPTGSKLSKMVEPEFSNGFRLSVAAVQHLDCSIDISY